jgi:hypothetical protein
MTTTDHYRHKLRTLTDWDRYLRKHANLPGKRANLELLQAVVELGEESLFDRYILFDTTDTPDELLAMCGVVGLGRLIAEGQTHRLAQLRHFANDPRWRIREAVRLACELIGRTDMTLLIETMTTWSEGTVLEMRAAGAGLCQPDLLHYAGHAEAALRLLDYITRRMTELEDRRSDDFKALRKGLAHFWSIAVVALPAPGMDMMARHFECPDKDVRWLMKQNLKKARLARLDEGWVKMARKQLGA